jgi:hypothetical protein
MADRQDDRLSRVPSFRPWHVEMRGAVSWRDVSPDGAVGITGKTGAVLARLCGEVRIAEVA